MAIAFATVRFKLQGAASFNSKQAFAINFGKIFMPERTCSQTKEMS
jgi:hypothetical protein